MPVEYMTISQAGIDAIKHEEGLALHVYTCPAGYPTIGYGHKLTWSERNRLDKGQGFAGGISEARAEELLRADVAWAARAVRDTGVALAQHQFDALVSFVFNVGNQAYIDSTLRRRLREGRLDDVPAQLLRWTKAKKKDGSVVDLPVLVARRQREVAMWMGVTAP